MSKSLNQMSGKVYLVGAGPGDVGLITMKGSNLIQECDVLVFDHLANAELRKGVSVHCEQIDVGKSPGRHTMAQEEIGKILIQKAKEGKTVVRLKGGDPFVFGRSAEEMIALDDQEIDYEIVPGVTAALACAAYSGIPLSHREFGSSISFLTGHEDVEKSLFVLILPNLLKSVELCASIWEWESLKKLLKNC